MRTPNCLSDKLIPKFESSAPTIVSGYTADLVMSCDYSPFGVTLDCRGVEGSYRYRFQGQEMDDEIKGEGNSVNYKYRMHCLSRHFGNPRVGRFFAVDPLAHEYPFYSAYSFSGNRVIDAVELEGLEPASVHYTIIHEDGTKTSHATARMCAVNDLSVVWVNQCCIEDDGRSIGVGFQEQASNPSLTRESFRVCSCINSFM